MDFIRLKYIERLQIANLAKPILSDRDGEVNTNWINGGNHSVTADATHVYSGTKSFKLVATAGGDFTTNFVSLASGNNATFVVGKKYCIVMRAYRANVPVTHDIQIKTGGVTCAAVELPVEAWTALSFVFTAISATTALQIAVITTTTNTAVWFELEAIYEYEDFEIVEDKGLRSPEIFDLWPAIVNKASNGDSATQYKAFVRNAILKTEALTSAQLIAYLYWTLDNSRLLDYDIQNVKEYNLVLIPPPRQEAQRYDDFEATPYLELDMAEGIARTDWGS